MEDIGLITTSESGVDLVVEWKIESFFNLSERDGAAYWSPQFSFGDKKWYLGIFPNGSSRSDSYGHVGLQLVQYSNCLFMKQSFSLSLKTAKGEKYNQQHFSKDFTIYDYFHTYNRLIPRSELTRRRSKLVPKGVLTIVCTMKNTTSTRNAARKYPQHRCVEVSTQTVDASIQTVEASIQTVETSGQTVEASIQTVEASIQTVETSTQTVEASIQTVETSTQTVEASVQTVEASVQTVEASVQTVEASVQTVEASVQTVEASVQTVEASVQTVEASIQIVEASIQTVETSTQTVDKKCEASASGSSTNFQEKKVLHDLKELFLKKEDCDVTIKVKGLEFLAHRAILKARSPVFASTFRHDMKENATGILEIEDCHPSTFSDFLCFLYCGDVSIISQENVFGLYTAADKYQILDLRAKCLEIIKKNLTVDTFCETLTLALRHSETELIKLSTDYFKKNIPKIIVTIKWQTFLAENPTESNELLVKCFVPNSS